MPTIEEAITTLRRSLEMNEFYEWDEAAIRTLIGHIEAKPAASVPRPASEPLLPETVSCRLTIDVHRPHDDGREFIVGYATSTHRPDEDWQRGRDMGDGYLSPEKVDEILASFRSWLIKAEH